MTAFLSEWLYATWEILADMTPRIEATLAERPEVSYLGEALAGRESVVYLDFCHLNHEGNQIMAVEIQEKLRAAGALDSR